MKQNNIKITRRSGNSTVCRATLKLEFDFADPEAVERFARIFRELVPEDERPQFVADWQAAARDAGFRVESR